MDDIRTSTVWELHACAGSMGRRGSTKRPAARPALVRDMRPTPALTIAGPPASRPPRRVPRREYAVVTPSQSQRVLRSVDRKRLSFHETAIWVSKSHRGDALRRCIVGNLAASCARGHRVTANTKQAVGCGRQVGISRADPLC